MSTSKEKALTQPAPEATPTSTSSSSLRSTWWFYFAAVALFTIAMMLVSFPAGFYTVFFTDLSSKYAASTIVTGFDIYLFFVVVRIPIAGSVGTVFVFCLVVYFVFFVFAAKQGAGVLGALRASLSEGYGALFTNPLVATLVLLGATALMTIVLDTVQTNSGIATGSLSGDPLLLLLDFTMAPLLEESSFRLLLLGVPVLILALVLFRDVSLRGVARVLWRPSSSWDVDESDGVVTRRSFLDADPSVFVGYDSDSLKARAMKPIVYVFLALSSFLFGFAHYASGSGWGPGKISEAALAGLALGYLYIKYGFHTSVMLHWSINYVGTIYSFLAQGLFGVPWTSNTGSLLDVVPTLDIVGLLGIPGTLILAHALLKHVARS